MDVYQRRRLVALSVLAGIFILFVLLIRSCGGDDEEAPLTAVGASGASGVAGATVLSQSDYVAEGDAICLEANTALAAVDEADAAQAAGDRSEIIAGELQQLQSLPAPDDGDSKLGKFLNALEQQSTALADQATALDRGDDTAAAELDATIEEAEGDAADAAKAFGFDVCGNPSKVGESSSASTDEGDGDTAETAETVTPDTGEAVTPTTTTPITPAPTTTTPAETVAPAPTDGGGATAAPAPPTDGADGGTSSGGVSP